MTHLELSERQRELLLKTLEIYISTGAPVGSHALSEELEASSSTIRAELAHLESLGLLDHPHTSAGRVPTDRGYRYYVDALMEANPKDDTAFAALEGYGNVDELLRGVSEGMSEVTRLLAVSPGPPSSVSRSPVSTICHWAKTDSCSLYRWTAAPLRAPRSHSPSSSRMMNCATSSQHSTPGLEDVRLGQTWSSGSPRVRHFRTTTR